MTIEGAFFAGVLVGMILEVLISFVNQAKARVKSRAEHRPARYSRRSRGRW